MLKDGGLLETDLAKTVIAAASLADFAAVLLLSVLFSADGGSGGGRVGLFLLFAGAVVAVAFAVSVTSRRMRVSDVIIRLQDTTAEIRVRAAMLLMVALAVLAEHIGLESILGAFLAGAAVAAIDKDSSTHPQFRTKLDAVGYGFLVPVSSSAAGCSSTSRASSTTPPTCSGSRSTSRRCSSSAAYRPCCSSAAWAAQEPCPPRSCRPPACRSSSRPPRSA